MNKLVEQLVNKFEFVRKINESRKYSTLNSIRKIVFFFFQPFNHIINPKN